VLPAGHLPALAAGHIVSPCPANGGELQPPHSSASAKKKIKAASLWEKNIKLSAKE